MDYILSYLALFFLVNVVGAGLFWLVLVIFWPR